MRKFKLLLLGFMSLLLSLCISSCGGSGSEGLNGGMEVAATADGSKITATATFTSPGASNYIGVPVTFYAQVGNSAPYKVVDTNFGPSGKMSVTFPVNPFNGEQDITVIATSDKVSGNHTVRMPGRTMTLFSPDAVTQQTTAAAGTTVDVVIPSTPGFVKITDPFTTLEHPVTITAQVTSTSGTATVTPTTTTTTWSGGDLSSPGVVVHMTVPPLLATETATVNWSVTDTISGLIRTGSTIVTLTKSS